MIAEILTKDVYDILPQDLAMKKLSANQLTHMLTVDQHSIEMQILLSFNKEISDFLLLLVIYSNNKRVGRSRLFSYEKGQVSVLAGKVWRSFSGTHSK